MANYFEDGVAEWNRGKAEMTTILQRVAARRGMIAYSELSKQMTSIRIDAFGLPMSEMLGEIAEAEDDAGRGLLTVIVVHKTGDQEPGVGFTRWQRSVDETSLIEWRSGFQNSRRCMTTGGARSDVAWRSMKYVCTSSALLLSTQSWGTPPLPATHHLWIWINEPQHAAAVQAVLGIITTLASIAAAFAALKAYLKTVEQVHIANEQLSLARRQANAAQRPFLVVEDELVEASPHVKGHILMVHNNVSGPVTNSYWVRESVLSDTMLDGRSPRWTRIGSTSLNGKAALQLPNSEKFASTVGSGILIHYQDLEGTVYFCRCTANRLGTNCDNGELSPSEPSPLRGDVTKASIRCCYNSKCAARVSA